jgi:hypothetical protein
MKEKYNLSVLWLVWKKKHNRLQIVWRKKTQLQLMWSTAATEYKSKLLKSQRLWDAFHDSSLHKKIRPQIEFCELKLNNKADFPNLYSVKTHTTKVHTKMRLMILDKDRGTLPRNKHEQNASTEKGFFLSPCFLSRSLWLDSTLQELNSTTELASWQRSSNPPQQDELSTNRISQSRTRTRYQ